MIPKPVLEKRVDELKTEYLCNENEGWRFAPRGLGIRGIRKMEERRGEERGGGEFEEVRGEDEEK